MIYFMKTIENKIGTQEEQSLVMKEMHDLASNIKYGKVINCGASFGHGVFTVGGYVRRTR